jgi:putative membrane protein
MTKRLLLAGIAGLLLAGVLIASQGATSVLGAVAAIGAGALWITLLRMVQIAGAGWAWRVLLPGGGGELLKVCVGLRWVREAINNLLPVAQIGGEIVGARLLATRRLDRGLAGASVLVDLLMQTATQLAFAILGVLLLAHFGGNAQLILWLSLGLAALSVAVIGFFLAQRFGGFELLERALLNLARRTGFSALAGVSHLDRGLKIIHDRRAALFGAGALHLLMWFVGAFEIWIALTYMGHSVGYGTAITVESLGHAFRAVGFLIPAGVGVQEGGFVVICAVFGIPAPAALALSLAKRVPEIALGVPGLLVWRVWEASLPQRGTNAAAQPLGAAAASGEAGSAPERVCPGKKGS